mmetsp:Transcript_20861/g.45223  ORF Transcript_20861/g.45223 Transcript_20861/m.45223 type:complete len:235 (-) Transcript_20861:53-757(-)|eukprot:CAMPEP_0168817348 /NCGR_PEP_ID=MMETSP0726-20121227/7187_1 /TAXON_ID=265536 /ORGANISM="Amphiprora sp., Strain CCMP467" /LENGTH=234 /DNA_ID=CAMNT_0008869625 /DNA_START=60 /DNA_END=764 /DNA_ORIENTATION=-
MELHHDCTVGGTVYAFYRRWGVNKLFRMADQGHWDKIPKRVKQHPQEALFVHRYAPQDSPLHRLLRPLHVTCPSGDPSEPTYKHSTDVLTQEERLEMEAKKELMNDPDIAEMLLQAVQSIVEANPAGVAKRNMFGRTPLHLACMELTVARAQAAEYMIQHTPMTTVIADNAGNTPLFFLLSNPPEDIPDSLIEALLKADPNALQRRNHSGKSAWDEGNESLSKRMHVILQRQAL